MYKKVVAALAMIFAMLFVSIGAFAASPAVQEVEALISQIGTVTRENRSAVESAVNAYNQLDEASKAAVSNYAVLAEAQQVLGIKDALAKLGVEYDKVQNSAAMRSPYSDKNEESGTCVFAPMLCIYEEYDFPVLFRFLYKGIIIKHNKTEPTYTKTSLFLCEKRRFFMARTEKGVVTTI